MDRQSSGGQGRGALDRRLCLASDGLQPLKKQLQPHRSAYWKIPPEEARRYAERPEIRYTPKHGSWINVAETELSVLKRQCLDKRVGQLGAMHSEVASWEGDRNSAKTPVKWQFTTSDARTKLLRLYPKL